MKKRTKFLIITILILVVALTGGICFGHNYYSKTNQVNRIVSAIQNDQEKQLANLSTTNDPSFKINGNSMKPTIDYYKDNKDQLSKLKTHFEDGGDNQSNLLELKHDGNAWLIFPRYKLMVKPVYANIYTNIDGVSLSVNGQTVDSNMGKEAAKKIGPLAPGHYNISTSGVVNGQKLHNDGQFDWLNRQNQSATLPLQIISFTVKGQPGSDVLVNDKKVGTIGDDGTLPLNNFPYGTNMTVQVSMKGKSGAPIVSKPYDLTDADNNQTITPEFDGIATRDDADTLLSSLWNDNISNADNDVDISSFFDGGKNNPAYQDTMKAIKGYNDDDDIDSFSCEEKTESAVPYDAGETQVTYQVKWKFDHNDDDDSTHTQVYEYTAIIAKSDNNNDNDDDDSTNDSGWVIKSNQMTNKISDTHQSSDDDDD